jgi:hypothetical protein
MHRLLHPSRREEFEVADASVYKQEQTYAWSEKSASPGPYGAGRIRLSYFSNFQAMGEILFIDKVNDDGSIISASINNVNPGGALLWGSPKSSDSTWQVYCRKMI